MKWSAFGRVENVTRSALYKLVSLDQISRSDPYDHEALLVGPGQSPEAVARALARGRFEAVVASDASSIPASWIGPTATGLQRGVPLADGDCISLSPSNHNVRTLFRRRSAANVLFTTGRCNSLCKMCSQPPVDTDDDWRVREILRLIPLLDRHLPQIGITGGEPTLLGHGLVDIVESLHRNRPQTAIHILSNGRLLGSSPIPARVAGIRHQDLMWGVPLLGDTPRMHDHLMGASGSFGEAILGIHHLIAAGNRVEIRVVLQAPLMDRLAEIARFIAWSVPGVAHVAFMGLEPMGYAQKHYQELHVNVSEHVGVLEKAVMMLAGRGIPVSLYNLPLCILPSALRVFARQSISDWKQKYLDGCKTCGLKSECGGFFEWTTAKWLDPAIKPVAKEHGLEMGSAIA